MGSLDAKRPVRRRSPTLLIVLAVGLASLCVATWIDHGRQSARPGATGTPRVVDRVAPEALLPARSRVDVRPAPHARKALASGASKARRPEPDPLEICGFGAVPLVPDDPYRLGHLSPAARASALDAVEARMLAHPDEEVQAAGLLIGARAGDRTLIDRLVRLALVSRDPLVYAIALEGCNSWTGGDAANCALLSPSQLARLDPDNAQPWLDLAAQARARLDLDAEFDAMRHAASARRSDAHQGLMPSLVDRTFGAPRHTAQRTFAASESWRIQESWSPSHTRQAQAFCVADTGVDPGRREVCEAIAATLAHRGTSVSDLATGLAIGRTLGWPDEQLEPLQREHDALAELAAAPPIGADLGCDAIDRIQGWMRQIVARGERQAMRDSLLRSGRSIDEWSDRHRKNAALAAATAQAVALSMAKDHTP